MDLFANAVQLVFPLRHILAQQGVAGLHVDRRDAVTALGAWLRSCFLVDFDPMSHLQPAHTRSASTPIDGRCRRSPL